MEEDTISRGMCVQVLHMHRTLQEQHAPAEGGGLRAEGYSRHPSPSLTTAMVRTAEGGGLGPCLVVIAARVAQLHGHNNAPDAAHLHATACGSRLRQHRRLGILCTPTCSIHTPPVQQILTCTTHTLHHTYTHPPMHPAHPSASCAHPPVPRTPACMPATASLKAGITDASPSLKRKNSFSSPVKAPPLACGTRVQCRGGQGQRAVGVLKGATECVP